MNPLQILIIKAAATLLGLSLFLGFLSWLLFKGIDLAADTIRTRHAARRNRREARHTVQARRAAGFGEQPTQLINLRAEHTQLLAVYEQEMSPLSDFYVFDDDDFPINRTRRSYR